MTPEGQEICDLLRRLVERQDGRIQELLERQDMMERGVAELGKTVALLPEMLAEVLAVLTKEEKGPSRLVQALEAMAARLGNIQAIVEWVEADLQARAH